ncbi:uncharacterized protein O3C94_016488 isoform 1-T1 [Discoglossus pictus]
MSCHCLIPSLSCPVTLSFPLSPVLSLSHSLSLLSCNSLIPSLSCPVTVSFPLSHVTSLSHSLSLMSRHSLIPSLSCHVTVSFPLSPVLSLSHSLSLLSCHCLIPSLSCPVTVSFPLSHVTSLSHSLSLMSRHSLIPSLSCHVTVSFPLSPVLSLSHSLSLLSCHCLIPSLSCHVTLSFPLSPVLSLSHSLSLMSRHSLITSLSCHVTLSFPLSHVTSLSHSLSLLSCHSLIPSLSCPVTVSFPLSHVTSLSHSLSLMSRHSLIPSLSCHVTVSFPLSPVLSLSHSLSLLSCHCLIPSLSCPVTVSFPVSHVTSLSHSLSLMSRHCLIPSLSCPVTVSFPLSPVLSLSHSLSLLSCHCLIPSLSCHVTLSFPLSPVLSLSHSLSLLSCHCLIPSLFLSRHPFPRKFSSCSKQQLNRYFQKGGGMCLFNMPNTKDLVMGKKCGNGFQEEGEECDCGEVEECTNSCCNANNCTLKAGAQCAHGECCQDCKLKSAGTLCREASGSCDLPEFCKGDAAQCPLNVYMLDGSSCARGEAYCYNGMCLSHEQQCIDLWGAGARPAPDICFQDVNKAGDTYGNCGKDAQNNYVKCSTRDAKCGKIQCQSSAQKPKGANMVPMDTTIRLDGYEVKCRGTFSYSTQQEEGDSSDPGLVLTGTRCGDGMVCWDRSCQNSSFFELDKCLSKCNGHGICNSNRNCHCDYGWAPPHCNRTGPGGSVDSGPMIDDFPAGLVVFLLLLFLVFLPIVAFGIYYCSRNPDSYVSKCLKKSQSKCGMCKGSQQKTSRGQSKSVFTGRYFSCPAKSSNARTDSRDKFIIKSSVTHNSSQPVNIVRPLRPAPSPVPQPSKHLKPSRPPPPSKNSPIIPPKEDKACAKLLPPKKPLPSCPVRTSQLNPPRKPLPGNPPHKDTLLVMTPSTSKKPPLTNAATELKGAHRPIPSGKVKATAAAFLQKK